MATVNNADIVRSLFTVFSEQLAQLKLQPEQTLIACLGGGADSQTILDLLDRYRQHHPELHYLAIHLDHQFHPDSGKWAEGLVADCKRRNFPHHCEVLAVPQGTRISKEAAGREARYQRLVELGDELAGGNAVYLLGQHRNDQIETFLLQLKRGAGPKGLASMAGYSERLGGRWLRPLLSVSKAQIYEYAHAKQLHWIEDDTNYNTAIDRNYLRHEVVPKLEQRWPHFGDAVLRSAELCAEQQALLDELIAAEVAPHLQNDLSLASRWLESASPQRQRAALRYWLQVNNASMPSYAQLEQLRMQTLLTTNNAQPQVQWGDCTVTRTNDRILHLTKS